MKEVERKGVGLSDSREEEDLGIDGATALKVDSEGFGLGKG